MVLVYILLQMQLPGLSQSEDQFYQQKIEELSENSSDEIDFSDLSDELIELKEHPVNLNTTTADELRKLPFLTEKQIGNLILYKETYGEIYSINELQAINGFDTTTLRQIQPYIIIGPIVNHFKIKWPDIITSGHGQFVIRYQQILQKQEGYFVPDSILQIKPNAGYSGPPQKYYFRFNYSYHDRISIGLTGEKDPGEEFFTGSQPNGMDYYGGYFCLKNTSILKTLVIGNFNTDFGQGLTLSSGLSFGSLASSGNLRRYAGRIKPSLSVNENNYFRGIAINLGVKRFEVSAFYSNHKRDANITVTDSISGDALEVSSFEETGYHRIPSELNDKNVIREVIYGGNVQFRSNYFSIGITGVKSHWSAALTPQLDINSQFAFRGKSNLNLGCDFQFIFRSIYGFGEVSESLNGGMAWLAGLQVNPGADIHFSLIYRDYQRSYQNLYCNAIGKNSKNSNERGLMVTISTRLSSQIGISAFVDIFQSPWLKYRTDFISHGNEFSCQADYSLTKQLVMMLKYRQRSSQINDNINQHLHKPINQYYRSLRYQIDWKISSATQLRNRIEIIQTSGEGRKTGFGYFICQDINFRPIKIPISLSLRYSLFDTDSYDERIYTFENDLLYSSSVPALEGTGIRCFFLVAWEPIKWLGVGIRYSQTYFTDREIIGTGLELINGNLKSEIKIQMQLKF